MATLRVYPGNVPEGGEVSFVLTGFSDTEGGQCYSVKITDLSTEHGILNTGGTPRFTPRFLPPLPQEAGEVRWSFSTAGLAAGPYEAVAVFRISSNGECPNPDNNWDEVKEQDTPTVARLNVGGPAITTRTFLQRASANATTDQALWVAIRNRTNALSFDRYEKFIDLVFCDQSDENPRAPRLRAGLLGNVLDRETAQAITRKLPLLNIHGPYAYSVLKLATQVFLTLEAGIWIKEHKWEGRPLLDLQNQEKEQYRLNDPSATFQGLTDRLAEYLVGSGDRERLPYLNRIVGSVLALNAEEQEEVLPYCHGVLQHRLTQPSLIELIWSYWHEEGMLAQTMNAIAMRFQNQRSGPNDPLAELEIDPLRPLNNIIWGYVQDEHNRLTVRRRAFEYDHHYGLKLLGRAVPELQTADSRSKFLEAFHNLLHRTAVFYREDSDTTVIAEAFPLLNALKDVHLLLAEGAHNQYGDLPWTARGEMLTQQWMLARPEMREFLRGRHMVPYQEKWMGAVDAMKKLHGWTDTTISHFQELAVDGERLLLSIRFGDWSELDNIEEQARNWARYWKPEVQRYLYGYLAATGVDLMADVTDNREAAMRYLQPSTLLQRRLTGQARQPALAAPGISAAFAVKASGDAALPGRARARALKHETGE